MRNINKMGIAAVMAAAAFLIVPATSAYASTPTCTGVANIGNVYMPVSAGNNVNCDMAEGDDSTPVGILQDSMDLCYGSGSGEHRVTNLGFNIATDGEFGPATKAALKKVQAYFHISADGEYGPQTAASIKFYLNQGSGTQGCVYGPTH